MKTIDILKVGLELARNSATFTTKAFARDSQGREVRSHDRQACQFCALGGLRAMNGLGLISESELIGVVRAIGFGPLFKLDRDQASAIQLFSDAIARLEGQQEELKP